MKVVRLSAFTPSKHSWYSFLLEADSTPGPYAIQCSNKIINLINLIIFSYNYLNISCLTGFCWWPYSYVTDTRVKQLKWYQLIKVKRADCKRNNDNSRSTHVGFMAHKVVMGQVVLRLLRFSIVTVIPPVPCVINLSLEDGQCVHLRKQCHTQTCTHTHTHTRTVTPSEEAKSIKSKR
jgi:hypothetical protein